MEQLVALISAAAGRLGVEGARVWPQIVALTFLESLAAVVCGVLLLAAVAIAIRPVCRRLAQSDDGGFWLPFAYLMGVFVAGIGVGIIATNLGGVFYPEATTVLKLMKQGLGR